MTLKVGDRMPVIQFRSRAISPPSSRRWCVVYTELSAERVAKERIAGLGYTVYMPTYTTRSRDRGRHRKWVDKERPLLPRYLFVHLAPSVDPWEDVRSTPGVHGILHKQDMPMIVPDLVIDELRSRE